MAKHKKESLVRSFLGHGIRFNSMSFCNELRSVEDFCSNEMVNFGVEVCTHRAIPSMIDGLKESSRKVLWCAKDNAKSPIKVFQLCGIVASKMAYVHGDASLNKTIIGMAQPYNSNCNLLDGIGQFGSYHFKEAASPRYISVKLSDVFNYIYLDNDLLSPQYSDGIECEPQYMLPIIPYVMCNMSSGIAMGFASSTLPRNPIDIVDACINELKKGDKNKIDRLVPCIDGFNGTFKADSENPNKWFVSGSYTINEKTHTIIVDDFIGSMDSFMEVLLELRDNNTLKYEHDIKNNKFKLVLNKSVKITPALLKSLKLESTFTENPTFSNEENKIVVYNRIEDIIKPFVKFRLGYYVKRKEKILSNLDRNIVITTNRIRFIQEYDKFYKKREIDKLLDGLKYDRVDNSFEYLLSMRVDSITKEKIDALKTKLEDLNREKMLFISVEPVKLYLDDLKALKTKLLKRK